MKEIVKNRSEILFLYDIAWANPNGDPADENKPRIDEETGKNIVTDVRLKRTVRDYLHDFKNQEIFVREIEIAPGNIQDAKARAEDFLVDEKGNRLDKSKLDLNKMKEIIEKNILSKCIDVRLFGATIPLEKSRQEKSSLTYTGPVQFKMGQSLHRVKLHYIKGTGAFASEAGKEQKTFREEWVLPYALICFYSVINENAAKITHLTEDDVNLLMEALWNGTKNLISRSKMGQMPRFLLRVVYKQKNYHIGDLDKRIKLVTDEKTDEEVRGIEDYKLDASGLIETLIKHKDRIEEVIYGKDGLLKTKPDDFENQLNQEGINVKLCNF